jgi:hypothetical protein
LFNGRDAEVKRDALDRLAREANVNPYVRKLTDALKAAAAKASAQDGQDD